MNQRKEPHENEFWQFPNATIRVLILSKKIRNFLFMSAKNLRLLMQFMYSSSESSLFALLENCIGYFVMTLSLEDIRV